jgi:hypothetical protein
VINSNYSNRAVPILASLPLFLLPMALNGQTAQNAVPLKNWATPLDWQPNQTERTISGKSAAQIQLSSNATSSTALIFIAVSPCRLVDTRGASAGFIGSTPLQRSVHTRRRDRHVPRALVYSRQHHRAVALRGKSVRRSSLP